MDTLTPHTDLIFHLLLAAGIIVGFILLLLSLLDVRKIIKLIENRKTILFWHFITLLISFFCISYLITSYLVFTQPISAITILTTLSFFAGAVFVFFILKNSFYSISNLSIVNYDLNETNKKLREQTSATADANVNMTQLYMELEDAKNSIEKKEKTLRDQNTQLKEMNNALAEANSNMASLYLELEEAKNKLSEQKKELKKHNVALSKTNVALADANANMTKLYIDLEESKLALDKKEEELKKQNESLSEANTKLSDANANIIRLYSDLEVANKQNIAQKESLSVMNLELNNLYEIGKIVNSTLDANEIFEKSILSLNEVYPFNVAIIQLFDEDVLRMNELFGIVTTEEQRERLKAIPFEADPNKSYAAQAITAKHFVLVPEITNSSDLPNYDKKLYDNFNLKSAFYFPLIVQNRVIGCVCLFSTNRTVTLSENQITSLTNHMALIAIAANNALTYIKLKETKMELAESEKISRMTNIFKKFVPEQFLNKIAREGIENIHYGYTERAKITILFADIRSFTSFAEASSTKDLFEILNKYFATMSQQIYQQNGFIDKFIGDAIMAIFDRPHNVSHADLAIRAAINMQIQLDRFNLENEKLLISSLAIGIGIHSGEVIFGTVGFENRMDSTILGDNVNIASRLESLTKEFKAKIIISEDTLQKLSRPSDFHYRDLGWVKVRGKEKILRLYEVYDCDREELRILKHKTQPYFKRGVELIAQRQWEKAQQEFQSALKIYKEDITAQYLLDCVMRKHYFS